jgi:hypothetical protein
VRRPTPPEPQSRARAISNATSPTSHGQRGGRALEPPDLQDVDRLGSELEGARDRMLLTIPPSRKCSPSSSTAGRTPGTAAEAITASTSGPAVNQCSDARSMLAATHWKGTARSSMRSGSAAQRVVAVKMRAGPRQRCEPAEDRPVEDAVLIDLRPDRLKPCGGRRRRVRRGHRPVDRADGGADDQRRGDAPIEQRLQHAHLVRPQMAAAPEHESHAVTTCPHRAQLILRRAWARSRARHRRP